MRRLLIAAAALLSSGAAQAQGPSTPFTQPPTSLPGMSPTPGVQPVVPGVRVSPPAASRDGVTDETDRRDRWIGTKTPPGAAPPPQMPSLPPPNAGVPPPMPSLPPVPQ